MDTKTETGLDNGGPGTARSEWPKLLPFRFIEPGLVRYSDVGTVLVKKETLDNMAKTLIGKPVVNENHRDVEPKDFSVGNAEGVVTDVFWNAEDGWFHGKMLIWDEKTKENAFKNGYSVSCAYNVKAWSPEGGIHNNIPYEKEVLNGEYSHLAIVSNPRYEGAKIMFNSKEGGGKTMKLMFWKKADKEKPEVQNSVELDSDKATVEIDGKEVTMSALVEVHNAAEAKKKAAADAEALNNSKLQDDCLVDLGNGNKVTIKALKDTWAAKNAEDEEEKKKKEDEEKDRENADAEKKKMISEHADGKHDEGEYKENCATCAKNKRANSAEFDKLDNAARNRKGDLGTPGPIVIHSAHEGVKIGRSRYGSAKKV